MFQTSGQDLSWSQPELMEKFLMKCLYVRKFYSTEIKTFCRSIKVWVKFLFRKISQVQDGISDQNKKRE